MICLLAGCGTGSEPLGVAGHVADGFGGAAADEPTAALVARDTLSAGGSAADAAVALYFALAATYPVAAGIGGGGVCLAYDAGTNRTGMIDFSLARMAVAAASGPDVRPPGNVRGMAALHARFGRLRWEELVLPGERIARFGHRISRALARSIAANAARLSGDRAARALFFRRDGSPLREGDRLEQLALATLIGQLRFKGAGALHSGPLARRYAESAAAIGARLPVGALRRATPVWRDPQRFELGDHEVSMVPSSSSAELWRRLFVEGAYRRADGARKAMAIVEATLAASGPDSGGDFASPDTSGTTSFAVIDRAGGAVACWLSMNGPFGSGRMLPGIGAFAPGAGAGTEDASLAIVSNANSVNTFFAAAASGGPASAAALVRVAGGVLLDGRAVAAALGDRRLAADPRSRTIHAEAGIADVGAAPLRDRGVKTVVGGPLGRVNAIHCAGGSRRDRDSCRYGVDPRGFGHAVSAAR